MTYPAYYFSIHASAGIDPRLVIYKKDTVDSELKLIDHPIPLNETELRSLIRKLAIHL